MRYFQCCLHIYYSHLDLHTFPTRRSSDLRVALRAAGLGLSLDQGNTAAGCFNLLPCAFAYPVGAHVDGAGQLARSEEHTSELQSRLHLVCRLLLEKKKKITNCRRQPTEYA